MNATSSVGSTPDERTHQLLALAAYVLTAVVGVTVLLVSSHYLHTYAIHAGMTGWLSWTLVVALDAGGIGGGLCWVIGTGLTRAWGRWVALGNLAASVLGNILGHLLIAKAVISGPWMQILTGAVYPAELWAMVHLALVLRTNRVRVPAVQDTVQDVEVSVPVVQDPAEPAGSVVSRPELLNQARQLQRSRTAAGLRCGRQVVMSQLGVSERVARDLLKRLDAEGGSERPLRAVGGGR